jgi:hypothetical protein
VENDWRKDICEYKAILGLMAPLYEPQNLRKQYFGFSYRQNSTRSIGERYRTKAVMGNTARTPDPVAPLIVTNLRAFAEREK